MSKQLRITNNVFFALTDDVTGQEPVATFSANRVGQYENNPGLTELNITSVFRGFSELRKEINGNLVKMDESVLVALLGLMTGDNVFLLSLPGAAKSTMSAMIGKAINGNFWRKNFTPGMDEADIYGPVSLTELAQNRFVRAYSGLATAHYALCDEIFKADPRTLSLLLDATEEKRLYGATGEHVMPLLSVISASNELPCANNQSAIWDRFGYRFEIERNSNADDLIAMIGASGSNSVIKTRLSPEDIMLVQAYCGYMAKHLPDDIKKEIKKIYKGLQSSKNAITLSNRRWLVYCRAIWAKYMLSVAEAGMNGKAPTKEMKERLLREAMTVGKYILWVAPEDREVINDILLASTSVAYRVISDAKARIEKIYNNINTSDQAKVQSFLKEIGLQIGNLKKVESDPETSKEDVEAVKDLINKAGALQSELIENQSKLVLEMQMSGN